MKVISFVNPKGGVGKTTSAYNVAASLADFGYRVLIIDLDPHGGLTKKFQINPHQLEKSLFQYLSNPKGPVSFGDFIFNTPYPNIDLIPGHRDLEALDHVLVAQQGIYPYVFVHNNVGMSSCRNDYKYAIIDTQPRYSPLVISALHASDLCVVPFIPETDTAEAFSELREVLEEDMVKEGGLNYKVLFTMAQEYTVHHSILMKAISETAPDRVFKTIIKRSIVVADAHSGHKPIVLRNKNHPVAQSYREFTEEVIQCLEKTT